MNLLFIEKSFKKVQDYTLSNVQVILLDRSQSYADILHQIASEKGTYQNIGIFSHGKEVGFEFLHNITPGNQKFVTFLKQLKTVTGFENLDLFPCLFGRNFEYINGIEKALDINIRASTDNTGNQPFGNWIMETDNLDVKDLYFDDSISNFQGVLLSQPQSNIHLMAYVESGKNQVISERVFLTNDGTVEWLLDDVKSPDNYFSQKSINKLYESSYNNGYIYLAIIENTINDKREKIMIWRLSVILDDNNSINNVITDMSILPQQFKSTGRIIDVCSYNGVFALLGADGIVDTISPKTETLENIQQIYVSLSFLENIQQIYGSFLAIKDDGRVVTFGNNPDRYGTIPSEIKWDNDKNVPQGYSKVIHIFTNENAVVALREDGSVVTWGDSWNGGTIPEEIKNEIQDIGKVYPMFWGFVAVNKDGDKAFAWGYLDSEYKLIYEEPEIKDGNKIEDIYVTNASYAILLQDKTVLLGGYEDYGGKIKDKNDAVQDKLNEKIDKIYTTNFAFAALTEDRDLIVWGQEYSGGSLSGLDLSYVDETYSNRLKGPFRKVYSNDDTFVAIYETGKIVVWGYDYSIYTDTLKTKLKQLSNVVQVYVLEGYAFMAVKSDNTIFTWNDDGVFEIENNTGIVPGIDFTDLQYDEVTDSSILDFYPWFRAVDLKLTPTVVCFLKGTIITTDANEHIPIENLTTGVHTIDGRRVEVTPYGRYISKQLVHIKPNAFGFRKPVNDIFITHLHRINYRGLLLKCAFEFAVSPMFPKVGFVQFQETPMVYNVILEDGGHSMKMNVSGILVETLHPDNPVSKRFLVEKYKIKNQNVNTRLTNTKFITCS